MKLWDGSPAAGKSLRQKGGVETHQGGLYAKPHDRGSATMITSEFPREARMALKDYSDNEAVRSRGQDLVSTLLPSFSDVQTCASCKRCPNHKYQNHSKHHEIETNYSKTTYN